MALVIPVVGPMREVHPTTGASFTLAELQSVVGGYLEAVPVGIDHAGVIHAPRVIMFVNETGKLDGLPFNPRATSLHGRVNDPIVGDVIVCTLVEAGETDEPERLSITCPTCGKTSYNVHDVVHRYCGHCHVFLDDPKGGAT